jgi:glutamate transport system substrate-binding protein
LRKGDLETCRGVNAAILKMYADGTAGRLMNKWFGRFTGLSLSRTPPPADGCS